MGLDMLWYLTKAHFLKQKCVFADGYFWSLSATNKQLHSLFWFLQASYPKLSQNMHIFVRRTDHLNRRFKQTMVTNHFFLKTCCGWHRLSSTPAKVVKCHNFSSHCYIKTPQIELFSFLYNRGKQWLSFSWITKHFSMHQSNTFIV